MPIAWNFDNESGLIRTTVSGLVTRFDIATYFDRVQLEPYFPAPSLTDVRKAYGDFSGDEVRAVTKEFRRFGGALRQCPIAVLVSSELSYGLTRMISLLLDDVADIQPFRDEVEAIAWLIEERARAKAQPKQ